MYILISRLNVWQVNGVDKYDILDNPIFLRNKCSNDSHIRFGR